MSYEEDVQLGLTLDLGYTAPTSELAEQRWEAFENAVRVAHTAHKNEETTKKSLYLASERAIAQGDSRDDAGDVRSVDSGEGAVENESDEANGTSGAVASHSHGVILTSDADMSENDRHLLRIEHKKEAKEQLSEQQYRRWKKLRHRHATKASSRSHASGDRQHRAAEDSSTRRSSRREKAKRSSSRIRRKRSSKNTAELSSGSGVKSRRTRKRGRANDGDEEEKSADGASAVSRTRRSRRGATSMKTNQPHSDSDDSADDAISATTVGDAIRGADETQQQKQPFQDGANDATDGGAPFMTADEALRVSTDLMSGRTTGAADATRRRTVRREQLLQQRNAVSDALGSKSGSAAKRLNASKDYARLQTMAQALVEQMRQARAKDELILSQRPTATSQQHYTTHSPSTSSASPAPQPPLYRIALKPLVEAQCRRSFFIGALVEAGVLTELSYWLYDFDHAEPAPYELRTSALDTLLQFPIEGEIESTRRHLRNGDEDLTVFMGLSREHLAHTDLGRAVNALRLHVHEVAENRSKAVQLLARLSRAMSGGVRESRRAHSSRDRPHAAEATQTRMHALTMGDTAGGGVASSRAVSWKCQSNRAVASPFEVVQTGSEAFQKAFMRPDPRDPTSYHNILPWRPPVSTITNLSRQLAEQIVRKDDALRR